MPKGNVENCVFGIKEPGDHCDGCVSVYLPMAGWKAQMIAPTPGDPEFPYCDVWQTGLCGWRTKREAQLEAKSWAEDEELIYLGGEIDGE